MVKDSIIIERDYLLNVPSAEIQNQNQTSEGITSYLIIAIILYLIMSE
jgi:hypothetical protein